MSLFKEKRMQLFKTEMIFIPIKNAPSYCARRRRYGCRSAPAAVQPLAVAQRSALPPTASVDDRHAIERAA
jgi:hypothetical protein